MSWTARQCATHAKAFAYAVRRFNASFVSWADLFFESNGEDRRIEIATDLIIQKHIDGSEGKEQPPLLAHQMMSSSQVSTYERSSSIMYVPQSSGSPVATS